MMWGNFILEEVVRRLAAIVAGLVCLAVLLNWQ
jgi:hypothetical protein